MCIEKIIKKMTYSPPPFLTNINLSPTFFFAKSGILLRVHSTSLEVYKTHPGITENYSTGPLELLVAGVDRRRQRKSTFFHHERLQTLDLPQQPTPGTTSRTYLQR